MSQAARRELGILRRVAKGIIEVGKKITTMNKEFLEDEEIIRITDDNFAVIKRKNLDCRYDLTLSISTAEDDASKAAKLAFMWQTANANMDPAFGREILADIADLQRMPDKAEKYRKYKPQPDPFAEEEKKLKLAKLSAEIKAITNKHEEILAEAEKERATAERIRAETALIIAQKDALDLKFVEDNSGKTHQRELEKQGAQADANMKLESHKKALERAGKAMDREEKDIDDLLGLTPPESKPIDTLQNNLTNTDSPAINESPEDAFLDNPFTNQNDIPRSLEPSSNVKASKEKRSPSVDTMLDNIDEIGTVD
jgi:hypothetical protein